MKTNLSKGKYVVAVSGGVDSMVLLDLLSKQTGIELVVAHFDHGIRKDSTEDRKLVEKEAKILGLKFIYENGNLGSKVSEAKAREARFIFLRRVKEDENAKAIVTAHHQDDALETLIINTIRGTGRRGVLKETVEIKRPLLDYTKRDILDYAKSNGVKWREDTSNIDTKYLRNYIRNVLIPKMKQQDPKALQTLLESNISLNRVNKEIENELESIASENISFTKNEAIIPRQWLIMLPNEVGREVLYDCARRLDKSVSLDRKNIKSLLVFAKTAKRGKIMELNKYMQARVEEAKIILELV